MKLIVGLGNPGFEYENTRHNVGFLFVDYLCSEFGFQLEQIKFNGLFVKTRIKNEDVIIAKPLTYMNLSGEFVTKLINFYKINKDDIVVIHDDVDTDLGKFKIKQKGSSGGQNGLKNIINLLGTENIKRIKIGIGKSKVIPMKDYVLGKLTYQEKMLVLNNFPLLKDVIYDFLDNNLIKAMNKYN